MQGILRTTSMLLVFAFIAVACDPGEDQIGEWDDSDTISVEATRANLQQVRTDVDSILNELRSGMEAMRAEVRDDRVEDWNQVASNVEDTRGDLMEDLREADATDRDAAERIRNDASERIAELEADVARSEIELTATAEALTRRVDQHLSRLESDIDQLSSRVAAHRRDAEMRDRRDDTARVTDRDRTAMMTRSDWLDLDDDDIRDYAERLAEARREAQQIPQAASDDDLEDVRGDLADKVADLTRDVREHVHLMKWTEASHTRNQRDTEYE